MKLDYVKAISSSRNAILYKDESTHGGGSTRVFCLARKWHAQFTSLNTHNSHPLLAHTRLQSAAGSPNKTGFYTARTTHHGDDPCSHTNISTVRKTCIWASFSEDNQSQLTNNHPGNRHAKRNATFETTGEKTTRSKEKKNSSKAFQLKKKLHHVWKITGNSCISDFDYAAYKNTFNKFVKYGTNERTEVRNGGEQNGWGGLSESGFPLKDFPRKTSKCLYLI